MSARLKSLLQAGVSLAIVTGLLAGCTFKKNRPDHPYASATRISKGFFTEKGKDGAVRLKTFIAGWAPEMSAGEFSSAVFTHYNHAEHVNLVFEIEQNTLVGKKMIPSFMDDGVDCLLRDDPKAKACRARWPNLVTFSIQNHFYYEKKKDSRGRETDVFEENSNRSHWSARPYMNLDLGSVAIKDWAMAIMWFGHHVDSVPDSEIEWQHNPSYFGFTIEASDNLFGSRMQGRFRFNFLEFKHKEDFKPTPYRFKNAEHINILHVIGKQISGDPANSVLYAAHWDTKQKHAIYLHGFPKEYEQIGIDVINHWNDVFEKVGHGRPLEAKISTRKYAFDLREPSIVWISDRRLGYSAPMGVGMALADVRNGEIKWGAVSVWGGMLEDLTNRYSPNASAAGMVAAMGGKPIVQLSLMEPKKLMPGTRMAVPDSLLSANSFEGIRSQLSSQMRMHEGQIQEMLKQSDSQLVQHALNSPESIENATPLSGVAESLSNPDNIGNIDLRGQLENRAKSVQALFGPRLGINGKPTSAQPIIDEISNGLLALNSRMNAMSNQIGSLDKVYNADYIQNLIKMPKLNESLAHLPTYDYKGLSTLLGDRREVSRQEMVDMIQSQGLKLNQFSTGQASFCNDRHLFDQADAYAMGIAQGNIDKVQAVRALIKDLLLHEVGHMLGLGHNFKENILPKRGSVPNVSKAAGLNGKPFSMDTLEAQAHDQFKNYTTVMGYKDGLTDVLMKYEDLTPGPGDVLSFEYLYNARYPIYPVGAKGEGDFSFANLTKDGFILDKIQRQDANQNLVTYRPAYFPACNDITASMNLDPFCARWDRGYDAKTIVKNHFQSYRGNMISQLTAFTDSVKGDSFWQHEISLWYRTLYIFGRVRVFYDFMRQQYESVFRDMVSSGSEAGIQRLLQFAETCKKMHLKQPLENEYQRDLEKIFKDPKNEGLLDLCVANGQTVSELGNLMQLPGKDYSEVNYFKSYAPGGMMGGEARAEYGRAFGTWKELARVPIKISALLTLTAPFPYSQWMGWVTPIPRYSREDGAYHMSTLYAKEYSAAIAAGTEMNLNLGNSELDQKTTIGRTVMSMGYFLYNSWFSNDVLTVGAPFVQNIRSQTEFRYSYAVVEVEREDEPGKQIARRFTGTVYNYYSRGPERVPEIYVFTEDRVVLRPPPGSLIMPVSPVRWTSKSSGYFYAIKLDYVDDFFDRLKTNSVRRTLNDAYQSVLRTCIEGEGDSQNGLKHYFNRDISEKLFPGFTFPETIGERKDSKDTFLRSVEVEFEKYYANRAWDHDGVSSTPDKLPLSVTPKRSACVDALRGQSLIVMAASVLNGYYFAELQDFLEKDASW